MPQLSEIAAEKISELIPNLDVRLRQESISRVAERVVVQSGTSMDSPLRLSTSLVRVAFDLAKQEEALESEFQQLRLEYEKAKEEERRPILARHLQEAPGSAVERARDVAALDQWLDLNAIGDRFAGRRADLVDDGTIALRAAQGAFSAHPELRLPDPAAFCRSLTNFATTTRVDALREEALATVTAIASCFAPAERLIRLGTDVFRSLTRITQGRVPCDIWSMRAAMTASTALVPGGALLTVKAWLKPREGADDMIRRAHAVTQLSALPGDMEALLGVAESVREDESEHVRQELARTLTRLSSEPADEMLRAMILEDPSDKVRGVALLELASRGRGEDSALEMLGPILVQLLRSDSALLIRCAYVAVEDLAEHELLPRVEIARALAELVKARRPSIALCRRAASIVRRLEVAESPRLSKLTKKIAEQATLQPEGKWRKLAVLPEYSSDEVVDCAFLAGSGGLGLALDPRRDGHYRLMRGERRRVRLWRVLYETAHPAPDKRQGYAHASAPRVDALVVIPPELMAEVTQTSVPGERLLGPGGEWGIFLPRVDTVLTAAERGGRPHRMVTAFGTLEIRLSVPFWKRPLTRLFLAMRYAKLAALRETSLRATGREKGAYIRALRRMGLQFSWIRTGCRIQGHPIHFELPWILEYFQDAAPKKESEPQ